MSGIDIALDGYLHREVVCQKCGNDLFVVGEETRRHGETIVIAPCDTCLEAAYGLGEQGMALTELSSAIVANKP